MTLRSIGTALPFPAESMMPRLCRADDACIWPQRSKANFRTIGGHLCAIAFDLGANAIKKERPTPHHAAAQHDRFRAENVDQVRQPQSQKVSLAFHRIAPVRPP